MGRQYDCRAMDVSPDVFTSSLVDQAERSPGCQHHVRQFFQTRDLFDRSIRPEVASSHRLIDEMLCREKTCNWHTDQQS